MSMRSVLVDGAPIARIGDVVTRIEPLDDGRLAWILASWRTHGPMWRVYCWALDDGSLLDLEAGEGSGVGLAIRAGRVFIGGHSWEIEWLDLESGARGAVPIVHGHELAACSRDGRYLATQYQGPRRAMRAQIHRVDGTGEPFAEITPPVVFSDDGRFAVHVTEDGSSAMRISLADRTTDALPLGAPVWRWRGLCPVRGAPRVVAWDATGLVVADLVTASVVARVAVEDLESVDDATVDRIAVSRRSRLPQLLELAGERWLKVPRGSVPLVLTPDGRRGLRHRHPVLDVIDTTTGTLFRAHRGHEDIVQHLVWARDGTRVATAATSGRIRLLHLEDPPAIAELASGDDVELDFTPDGRRLCAVSASEIAVWDVATRTAVVRFAWLGTHTRSAEVSADGRRVLTASTIHGLRIFDLETGACVVVEGEPTAQYSRAVFAGDRIVAFRRERMLDGVGEPVELVHWLHLDGRGAILDRGTWRFEGVGSMDLELCTRGATAMVACYRRAVHELHTFDLREPAAAPRTVPIPSGEKLLDACDGRALLCERDDLVCRDPATGAELDRIRCLRRPRAASLSHDGTGIAVAYTDQGVEVFAARGAPGPRSRADG